MFRAPLGLILALNLGSAQIDRPDVLVIGAGIAGLTTALEAARGGASVAVVDIASVFGGHAVVSEGGLALVATPLQQRLGVQDSPPKLSRGAQLDCFAIRAEVDPANRNLPISAMFLHRHLIRA